MTRHKMFAVWFGVAFCLSWAIAIIFSGQWRGPGARAIGIVHVMPVLFATLLVQGPLLKQPVLGPLGFKFRPNAWWLVSWLWPLLLFVLAGIAGWLLFGTELITTPAELLESKAPLLTPEQFEYAKNNPPSHPISLVLQALPAGITINLLFTIGEEMGFRGFLFREVSGGFWRRSIIIGALWGVWFAPSVYFGRHFPENSLIGVGLMLLWCVLASPCLVYLRIRGDSVFAPAIARGTLVAFTSVCLDLQIVGEAFRPMYGLTGSIALAASLLLFFMHDRFIAETPIMSSRKA